METIQLSSRKFLIGCLAASACFFLLGKAGHTSPAWIATELILTILGLFFLGSFRYQLDKNALTYGMVMVIIGTFIPLWWPASTLKAAMAAERRGREVACLNGLAVELARYDLGRGFTQRVSVRGLEPGFMPLGMTGLTGF